MGIPLIGGLLAKIASPILGIIDKSVKDKDLAAQLKNTIQLEGMQEVAQQLEASKDIILAESNGSWMQRNWRPTLMLSIVAIIVNNYILLPWLTIFGIAAPELDLPSELYTLMTTGVGGYVITRSAEKIANNYTDMKNKGDK